MKKILFIFYAIILFGCDTVVNQKTDVKIINELKKEWTHSIEEETDSIQIFRSSYYKEFPILRYRQIYTFTDSGKCKYYVLAPNDAHYFSQGSWSYNEENKILTITNSSQMIIKRIRIISVTNDLLKFIQL